MVGKSLEEWPHRQSRKQEENLKIDIREAGFEGGMWTGTC
jgi:hypothetical protein